MSSAVEFGRDLEQRIEPKFLDVDGATFETATLSIVLASGMAALDLCAAATEAGYVAVRSRWA